MGISRPKLGRWIARIGYGSDEHLRRVYDACGAELLAVCTNIVGNQQLAETALKNCFVTVWHTAASFPDTDLEPNAWLISIARKEAFALSAELHAGMERGEEHMRSDIHAVVLKSGLVEHFRNGLENEEAGEAHRAADVLKLMHDFGLTYKMAARYLGVDQNELKALVHRELLNVREEWAA